jgi:hypothetical protein
MPIFEQLDSSRIGQARAALEHFQGVMRQHREPWYETTSRCIWKTARQPATAGAYSYFRAHEET